MKKKTIAVILAGTFLLGGSTVYAGRYIQLPWTKVIYNISNVDRDASGTVSTFDDKNIRCYVARTTTYDPNNGDPEPISISCVKR